MLINKAILYLKNAIRLWYTYTMKHLIKCRNDKKAGIYEVKHFI